MGFLAGLFGAGGAGAAGAAGAGAASSAIPATMASSIPTAAASAPSALSQLGSKVAGAFTGPGSMVGGIQNAINDPMSMLQGPKSGQGMQQQGMQQQRMQQQRMQVMQSVRGDPTAMMQTGQGMQRLAQLLDILGR